MSEFDFDGWLDNLKYIEAVSSGNITPDLSDISEEEIESQEFIDRIGHNFSLAIQVMESGIFREQKLKGRKISGKYRLYAIENMKEFLIEVVNILNGLEYMKERKQRFKQQFDYLIDEFDELSNKVLECKGVRPEKVKAMRNDLTIMKDRTLNKLGPISGLPPDTLPSLINSFKKNVSNAPNQTIATRISDLLKIAGFQVNQETIRKKLQTQNPPA